jgi:nucleoside-diphosphate-sugar epimerase
MELHVIVGAGGLGRSVARALVSRGMRVRLLSRSGHGGMEGAESLAIDVADVAAIDSAFAGAAVVYQCAQPEYLQWEVEFPSLQKRILDAAVRAGADLVIGDNLYAYGDPDGAVISEDSAEKAVGRRAQLRKQMAEAALDAHRAGRLRVAISRASDYYGPGHDQSSKGIFGSAVRGKSMQFFGRTDVPHSFSYVPDAGRAMAILGTSEFGWGRVWIPPVQPAVTQAKFGSMVWAAAGQPGKPKISRVTRTVAAPLALFVPIVRALIETLSHFEHPYVVDSSEFENTFGVTSTPMDESIAETIDWYRSRD